MFQPSMAHDRRNLVPFNRVSVPFSGFMFLCTVRLAIVHSISFVTTHHAPSQQIVDFRIGEPRA